MPILHLKSDSEFHEFHQTSEAEFEKLVVKLSEYLFGTSAIYFDIKKRVKGKEIISIPDGYLLELSEPRYPRLFVIENEIVSHDPFKHVGSQLLRFVVSFEDARTEIRNMLMMEIQQNKAALAKIELACEQTDFRNIDNLLDAAVYSEFRGLVVIDEARPELNRVIEKINANISVLELKTYKNHSGDFCYEYDTLFDDETDTDFNKDKTPELTSEEQNNRRQKRLQSDTIIVPAREEGFNRVFLGEDRWYEIRIGAAMKDKIKYIAAYQVAPISAITHIAEVKEIKPYQDTGKYQVIFKGPAKEIEPLKLKDLKFKPQGPVYSTYERLKKAKSMDDALADE